MKTVYNNRKNRLNFAAILAETQKGLRKKSRTSPEKTGRAKSRQSICKQHGTSMTWKFSWQVQYL